MRNSELSLYIHIPFCVRKCLYCDFLSFDKKNDTDVIKSYTDTLIKEVSINYPMFLEYEIASIFIGGGTPTLIDAEYIEKLLLHIKNIYDVKNDCEITIECNPGTADYEKLLRYRECGINRLSIGLQSADDNELRTLGRIHTVSDFEKCYADAVRAGFLNINIDLIYGIPGQNIRSYERTLRYVTELKPAPAHISAYSLIIEEGTPFYEIYKEKPGLLPDEEEVLKMTALTGKHLLKKGFHRYEISNYAKKGRECFHNKVYWQRGAYLGLGLGASSMADNIRWKNTSSLTEYLEGGFKKEEYQSLGIKEQMEEFMFLGLRMLKGVSIKEFEEYFGKPFPKKYWDIIYHYENIKLFAIDEDENGIRVRLTDKGLDVSNAILSEFLF